MAEALRHRGMGEDPVAPGGGGETSEHRSLDGDDDLSAVGGQGRRPQDPIAVALHDGFEEPAVWFKVLLSARYSGVG